LNRHRTRLLRAHGFGREAKLGYKGAIKGVMLDLKEIESTVCEILMSFEHGLFRVDDGNESSAAVAELFL